MVKKSEQSKGEAVLKNTQAPAIVSVSKSKISSLTDFWKQLPRINKLIVVLCLLALCVGFGIYSYQNRPQTVTLLTEEQASQSHLNSLKQEKPTAKASAEEKTAYYQDLELTNTDVGNIEGAIEAFKQREAAAKKSLTYVDYLQLAQYYQEINNNAEALKALDTAYAMLPPGVNENTGYVRNDVAKTIDTLRAELSK